MPFYRQTALRGNLDLRCRILQAIRLFFTERDYLEVETPNRIPAPAPETHIEAFPSGEWFLHTSPELCMKRLLASGYERIFQICKCYRAGERGARHLSELTLLEWYTADAEYTGTMSQCEALVGFVADRIDLGPRLLYGGRSIDLAPPWPRISVEEAFDRFAAVSMERALRSKRFDEILALEIEPHLGLDQPVFLYDYPAEVAALARRKPGNRRLAERFELYVGGLELCNAFSELTDPTEQRLRFEWEQNARRCGGKRQYPMPEKFLQALGDMPPAAGNALGVDRLVMLFAGTDKIDHVVAFTPEEL